VVEVTRSVRIQAGCRDCMDLILRSLSTIDGVLLMKFFDNDLVITYDTDRIKFGDIAELILSMGIGLFLRKVILNIGGEYVNVDQVSSMIVDSVDGVVYLLRESNSPRLSILAHPDTDLNAVINELRGLGVNVRGVVNDEVTYILMAQS
jgi:hypothetical protein